MPTEVWILSPPKGAKVIGKVRLVNKRGVEVTEEVNNSFRATLQTSDNVIGKVILADAEGNPLPFIEAVSDGLKIENIIKTEQKVVSCPVHPVEIPGIAAVAEGAADCLGAVFEIKVPKSGIIYSATYWDLDYEGTQVNLHIFKSLITKTGDNNPWAPSDFDILELVTRLAFVAFDNHTNSYTSELTNIGVGYNAPEGKLIIQAECAAICTIAAGKSPRVQLQILSDDPDWEG